MRAVTVLSFVSAAFVSGTRAATAIAQCSSSGAESWMMSTDGKNPCQLWAQMRNVCDSTTGSDVKALSGSGPSSYTAPSSSSLSLACDCNQDAYNLMASCTYCQRGLNGNFNWTSAAQWYAHCPHPAYSFSAPPGSTSAEKQEVQLINSKLPLSVTLYLPANSWDPEEAEACKSSNNNRCPSEKGTSHSGGGSSSGGSGSTYYAGIDWKTYWIIVGVAAAVPALCSLIALIVCCTRNSRRRKFYRPLAQYYQAGGVPPPSAYTQEAGVRDTLLGSYGSESYAMASPYPPNYTPTDPYK